jgi:STE24 endopeptidase
MIGTGYVGLVSGACFADFGHLVTCVDIDAARIEALGRGEIPIYEPGLKDVVARNVDSERLFFTTDLAGAVREAEVVFIAVGTPSADDGATDLTYVFGAAKRIVFFDTLLARLAPAEVEAVLAHELGHYRRHHVWKRIALLFALSLALLWVLGQLLDEPWFTAGLNAGAPGDAMGLLLFVLVMPVFTFFLQPLTSLYSRRHEFEADAYAAAHASAAELVRALVKLYQDNAAKLTPDPMHSAF